MPPHTFESPAKKQSKWSSQEDSLIIELRGSGMKWDDISKQLPGRSSISCRLHYQNYLERRSEWDEERKNKLARLYERFKSEMWAKVAEEMQLPWRAVEAMHWQLGEVDMARRAGVVPFSLNVASNEPQGPMTQRISPTRGGHAHSQSQGSIPRDFSGLPSPRYTRGPPGPLAHQIPPPTPTSAGARRESFQSRGPFGPPLSEAADYGYGLAPIQTSSSSLGQSRGSIGSAAGGGAGGDRSAGSYSSGGMLPGVAELTTGVSPYSTPAYAQSSGPPPPPTPSHYHTHNPHHQQQAYPPYQHQPSTTTSPIHSSATASPGPGSTGGLLPALSPYPQYEPAPGSGKRRASPPDHRLGSRETSRRRQHLYSSSSAATRDGPARDDYPPPPPPPPASHPHPHPQQPSAAAAGFGMGPVGPVSGLGSSGLGSGLGPGLGMGAVMPARRGTGTSRHGL